MIDLLKSAYEFVGIQTSLLTELNRIYNFVDTGDLDSVPKKGTITTIGYAWNYQKHGDGIKFTRSDGAVIDAHRAISIVNGIDAWRLARFLGSISANSAGHREIEKALSELVDAGQLVVSRQDENIFCII